MHNLVHIYESNSVLIERFIVSSLRQMNINTTLDTKRLFASFPSLELLYMCDTNKIQTSPNIFSDREDAFHIGIKREYLILNDTSEFSFHSPYISSATGKLCITLVVKTNKGYLLLDFRLRTLLERFDLIEKRKGFSLFNTYAYGVMAFGLIFLGLFAALYGFYNFGYYFFKEDIELSLEMVFKPVIALTLGLAVYDLGKTILEQDVLPKTKHRNDSLKAKSLSNFLVSIIVALFIEALLVVFKISITNYQDLPYGAIFIVSLSILLFVFAYFDKRIKND